MEHAPLVKPDEEFPLLRVEAGGGDVKVRPVPASVMENRWNVTCTPKQSWCNRWPELVSAFWMTLILLAISFLVFYALGMSAYLRQPIVIVRYNNTKPRSEVFFHHIIPRDSYIPFSIFSDYLTFMARQYPSLRFSVYFLIDDSWQSPWHGSRYLNSRLLNRLVPHITSPLNMTFNKTKDIKDFQKIHQNVNICIMLLSKYMAMTPLKYKWKMIPHNHLSFYVRIYEVWQNGGIGFDLVSFNNYFNINGALDKRIDAILKNNNNSVEPEKYKEIVNIFYNDEENELFSMFFHVINHVINETRSFFDSDIITNVTIMESNPKIKTHRNKRNADKMSADVNITNKNNNVNHNSTYRIFNETEKNITKLNNEIQGVHYEDNFFKIIRNISTIPKSLYFHDVTNFYGDAGATQFISNLFIPSDYPNRMLRAKYSVDHDQKKSNLLVLSNEGHFIATSSRHHPFLNHLFSSSCFRLSPKIAIKDTLLEQCSGFFRDDVYCESIHVVFNVI